jgi:hypothetical protein
MALLLLDGDTIVKDLSVEDLKVLGLSLEEAIESGEDTEANLEGQTLEIVMNPGAMEQTGDSHSFRKRLPIR